MLSGHVGIIFWGFFFPSHLLIETSQTLNVLFSAQLASPTEDDSQSWWLQPSLFHPLSTVSNVQIYCWIKEAVDFQVGNWAKLFSKTVRHWISHPPRTGCDESGLVLVLVSYRGLKCSHSAFPHHWSWIFLFCEKLALNISISSQCFRAFKNWKTLLFVWQGVVTEPWLAKSSLSSPG